MRVITGKAGGKSLDTLKGLEVRPTVARVKEALFSSIQFEVQGSRVLDLFAGSGQLGIECLSRGAKAVTFVDNSKYSLGVVEKNLKNCGFRENFTLINSDSILYLSNCNGIFDIVFLDPPYNSDCIERALSVLPSVLSDNAVVICETPYLKVMPDKAGDFSLVKSKKYGKTKLTYYRKSSENI